MESHELVRRFDELVARGNVRRISLRTTRGQPMVEIPLPLGVTPAALGPARAAVYAISQRIDRCIIVVERELAWR